MVQPARTRDDEPVIPSFAASYDFDPDGQKLRQALLLPQPEPGAQRARARAGADGLIAVASTSTLLAGLERVVLG